MTYITQIHFKISGQWLFNATEKIGSWVGRKNVVFYSDYKSYFFSLFGIPHPQKYIVFRIETKRRKIYCKIDHSLKSQFKWHSGSFGKDWNLIIFNMWRVKVKQKPYPIQSNDQLQSTSSVMVMVSMLTNRGFEPRSGQPKDYKIGIEQNRIFIGVKSIYKGLLPKQHIKYKTTKLLNTIKLHTLYMFEAHASLTTFSMRWWYSLNRVRLKKNKS